jgi:alkanesulfonate monooxygenase SsuD/methylene tetrahydromethanopterin reductase-like flavin-dependent oxidoreductase (luciferase family)
VKLGAQLSLNGPFEAILKRAALAEHLGLDMIGTSQISGRDAVATLSAISASTKTVHLATAVLPIYTRSPASMAQAAATLDDISGGRFHLGLGVGHRATMGGWHGQEIGHPVDELREYVSIVSAVLAGSPPPAGNRWNSSVELTGFHARPDLPILLAALSPAMLRMAAQVADGLLLWTTPASYIADVVIPEATRAREHRGLSMEGFEVIPIVSSAYVTDPAAAIEGARTELHRYFGLPFYRTMFKAAGFAADLDAYDAAAPDIDKQKQAISENVIRQLCIFGTESALADGIGRYRDAGATTLLFSGPPNTSHEDLLAAVAEVAV